MAADCEGKLYMSTFDGMLLSLPIDDVSIRWLSWNAVETASGVLPTDPNDFSCIFLWARMFSGRANARSHRSHLCGFRPVWVKMCLLRYFEAAYPLPQISQMYGFSPVWVRSCISISFCLWYGFWQNLHLQNELYPRFSAMASTDIGLFLTSIYIQLIL